MRIILFILFIGLGTCSSAQTTFSINFIPTDTTGTIQLDVFRFYISHVRLFQDERSQSFNDVWLLDNDEEGFKIKLSNVELDQIDQIQFLIGTDSLVNVAGAFDGALDPIHGMYWAWNSGYINVKLEGTLLIADKSADFEYHIGGYAGEHKTARLVTLPFNAISSNELTIDIDLNNFIDYIEIDKTNRVMLPGKQASLLATFFAESFSIHE